MGERNDVKPMQKGFLTVAVVAALPLMYWAFFKEAPSAVPGDENIDTAAVPETSEPAVEHPATEEPVIAQPVTEEPAPTVPR